jgi:hypothetical protein
MNTMASKVGTSVEVLVQYDTGFITALSRLVER